MDTLPNNILYSIKKMLGLDDQVYDFDSDILMNLAASVLTLKQIGVKFNTTSITKETIYDDLLSESDTIKDAVRMYLFYKTKVSFDPPSSSIVMDTYKELIRELEFRILVECEDDGSQGGGELSK